MYPIKTGTAYFKTVPIVLEFKNLEMNRLWIMMRMLVNLRTL